MPIKGHAIDNLKNIRRADSRCESKYLKVNSILSFLPHVPNKNSTTQVQEIRFNDFPNK